MAELVPGTLVPGLAQLAGLVLIGQLAGDRMLGFVSLAWVTSTFGAQVLALGPAHAAVRSVSMGDPGIVPAYRRLLLRRVLRAVPVLCTLSVLAHGAGSSFGLPLLYGMGWLAGQAVILFEVEILKAERRFARHSAVLSGRALAAWAGSIAAVAVIGGLGSALIPHVAISFVVAAWLLGPTRPSGALSDQELRATARPVSRLAVASYALGYADRYVVAFILGPAAVGVYSLGYRLAEGALELLTTPLVSALLPRTIEEWHDPATGPRAAEATVRRGAGILLAVTAVLVPVVVLAHTQGLLDRISDHRYFAAVVVLAAVGVGLSGVVRLLYGLMLAQGRAAQAMRTFWLALGLAAAVVPLMTYAMGIVGTAASSLAVYAILTILMARGAVAAPARGVPASTGNGRGVRRPAGVLHITEFFPASSDGEITGGVEARSFYLAHHLGPERFSVIARHTDGTHWDHSSLWSVPRRMWFMSTAVVGGLRRSFDVVESTNIVTHPVAWLLGRLRRRPVVFFYPDVIVGTRRVDGSGAARALETALERLVLRLRAAQYIAPSEAVAAKLETRGVPRDRIAVVPCGVDFSVARQATGGRAPRPGTHDVAVVGRLVTYKRVDLVLAAVTGLASSLPEVSVVVVGQGPEAEGLSMAAHRLQIADRVDFRGFVARHADVLETIAGSRVFVSASEAEGFGIALAEAMVLGVPYVVADIPAFREVSGGGRGGYLFTPGDVGDLMAGLRKILDADPEERRQMGQQARDYALERYGWDKVATATAAIYDALADRDRATEPTEGGNDA